MSLPIIRTDTDPAELETLMRQARQTSDLLKALSHEVRLMILCLLSEGEKTVSEIEDLLTMPQSAVSQQLARLRTSGLVQARRDGRQIYYSMAGGEVSELVASLYGIFCKEQSAARTEGQPDSLTDG